MSVRFPKKYYIIFIVLALVSAVVVYWATSRIVQQEENAHAQRLERVNREAATVLKESLDAYATLLTGIKTYIELQNTIPEKKSLQNFLEDQLEDLTIEPPFSVSYIDTNHIFQFDFTMQTTIPVDLEGASMEEIIGKTGVERMSSLMTKNEFYASNPTNLLEGRVGLPLGFGVLNDQGESMGYISSVTEFAPVVERVYSNIDKEEFVFKFQSANGNYFDRTRSYNQQKVYAARQDPEYFKNFNISEQDFVSSVIPFYNKEFTVSTAYKNPIKNGLTLFVTSFIWYLAILGFMLFLISQYYIYEKKNKIIDGQRQQLSELVGTKNKFFSIIAHDLRSPLSSVINFLDILKDEDFNNDQTKAIIDSLENSSRSSISLLDNLLKWSKVQTGQITYNPAQLDILSIVKDQVKIQNQLLMDKGLNVRVESSFKGKVLGDKNMIATVIRNLLSNAIKFSHDNDIIDVELSTMDGDFSFSIEDNGVGLSPDYRKKLLDVTQMATQEGTHNERGSGLGLILCDQFMKLHKGTLNIESLINKGTIVTFTLPLLSE